MDNLAVSRRNHNNKKGNKENTQPALGSKSLIKKDKTPAAPFTLKSNEREGILAKNDPLKAKAKQADTRSTPGEALKNVKSVQRDGKRAATAVKQRQTHSQAFLTEQIVKHKKMVVEAPKPPAPVASLKCAPGMYKGKVVQSKIGSIWKSSAAVSATNPKPPAPKPESQRFGNVAKNRSKSVTENLEHDKTKPEKGRSKSVSSRPVQLPKAPASSRPPTRAISATVTTTRSTKMTVAPTKASGTLSSRPKTSMTDKKINKPPVSSTLSQYRLTKESAEERRAKLADWLASKGKTLKRPAMATAVPSKTSKVSANHEANFKPQPPAQRVPEPSLEAQKPDSAAAALCADTQGAAMTEHSHAPVMMDTSLDLLDHSDADLAVDPQDSVEDIVVNLCDALEALETPSRCSDELTWTTDECNTVEMESKKTVEECKKEELKNGNEQVKDEAEESDDQKEETEEVESDDDVIETPQMEEASVIRYSVKTTPYLQSVKKTIEGEACTSASRKKSNIKDIKFLTPVRRSCRIQRKSSRLPAMLTDHDPCVSSLAELVKLDDDPNAYVVRKNTALLEDVLDQHTE